MKAILISALNWTQVSSTESHIVVWSSVLCMQDTYSLSVTLMSVYFCFSWRHR
jgi:hypothetical protein